MKGVHEECVKSSMWELMFQKRVKIMAIEKTEEKKGTVVFAVAEFRFKNAELLKRLFQAIGRFCDEPVFTISMDALCIRQMDPSRVVMLDYKLDKHDFDEWSVHTPGVCCFNMEEVLKVVFSKLTKDTEIEVFIDGKDDTIHFTLKDTRVRKRSFPLLEPTIEDEIPAPKIDYRARYKIMAKQWQDDILDMEKVSDHVKLFGYTDKLVVKAEGDVVKGENTYKKGSDMLLTAEVREESKATYSLNHLKEHGVDPNLCDVASLELSTDMPLKVTLDTQLGPLYHYLAPRIETE